VIQPKPEFWTEKYATAWQHPAVADAYQYRPGYPPETCSTLSQLIADSPRNVLDIGCGTGGLARYLIPFAARIDAVDISLPMIQRGEQLPHGADPKLYWHVSRAEDFASKEQYALVTAGESLHWMDWDILMPRLESMLSPNGVLAICVLHSIPHAWESELVPLYQKYSTMPHYRDLDLVAELTTRALLTVQGSHETEPFAYSQSLADYVESFHARASLAHGRLDPALSAAFDRELRERVGKSDADEVKTQVIAKIVWGKPHARIAT
jgi:2-polyprenyl-3-methyl-5-hydroxy-6-metoxy-1,4-benzoquinol methylase